MKITVAKTAGFEPITVAVECSTQEEVNALYLLGNHSNNITKYLQGNDKECSAGKAKQLPVEKVLQEFYVALVDYKE